MILKLLDKDGIVQKISEEGFSRYPIYLGDIDNIIGVIYAKDLFKELISKKFRTIKILCAQRTLPVQKHED